MENLPPITKAGGFRNLSKNFKPTFFSEKSLFAQRARF